MGDFDALTMWVIYDHPAELPDWIVVRVWRIAKGSVLPILEPLARCYQSLEQARRDLPRGLVRLPRDEHDEPQILETWL